MIAFLATNRLRAESGHRSSAQSGGVEEVGGGVDLKCWKYSLGVLEFDPDPMTSCFIPQEIRVPNLLFYDGQPQVLHMVKVEDVSLNDNQDI